MRADNNLVGALPGDCLMFGMSCRETERKSVSSNMYSYCYKYKMIWLINSDLVDKLSWYVPWTFCVWDSQLHFS